jgi:hypothetical protein
MNSVVETSGYRLLETDEALKEPDFGTQKALDKLDAALHNNKVKPELVTFFNQGKSLLADPFNYYSFGITLSKD